MNSEERPWTQDRMAGIANVISAIHDILSEHPNTFPEEFVYLFGLKYPNINVEYDESYKDNQEKVVTLFSLEVMAADHLFLDMIEGQLFLSNELDYSLGGDSVSTNWERCFFTEYPETGEIKISKQ